MALELEINAATRAFLPKGAMEFATPVRRVELKLASGESRVIIGQLIPTYLNVFTRRPQKVHEYTLLIYRPEFSDVDINLVAWREDTPTTYEQACELCWEEEFESILSGDRYRFWLPSCAENSFYILFSWGKEGTIYRIEERRFGIRFHLPPNVENALYKMSSNEIDQFSSSLYAGRDSDFRLALDWMALRDDKKEEIAFACENGNWSELRAIARQVIQVLIGSGKALSEDEFFWRFLYPAVMPHSKQGIEVSDSENFLCNWRAKLIDHFQPKYIDGKGIKKNISLYLEDYISRSEQGAVKLHSPSYHEVIEAQFQLSNWLQENST